jgi:ornithine lipid ester-linked acyl 2-hydroxylase
MNTTARDGPASDARPQVWATDGIDPMTRAGLLPRLFLKIVAWVERLNFRYAKLGNPYVYENSLFPWVAEIEKEWLAIRRELDHVLLRKMELPSVQDISPDAASINQDAGWKMFLLVAYGVKSRPNIDACPETWRNVQRIPGLKTAMFSIFEPGKRLPAHRGPYNGVLRLHLGLIVPEPREQSALQVGDQIYHWQEGRAVIFDDAYEHLSWNGTDSARVILFVDFVKPLYFPANLLNALLLRLAVFTPFIRESYDNLRKWEQRFYGEALKA